MKRWERQTDLLVYLLAWFIVSLPFWLFRVILSASIHLLTAGNTGVKKLILRNLNLVFPEKPPVEKKRLARQILWNAGVGIYQDNRLYQRSWVSRMTEVEGRNYLEAALAKGKGVVGLSAHLGNFGVLLTYLSQRYPVKTVVNDPRNPYLQKHIIRIREMAGIRQMNKRTDDFSLKESMEWLRTGNMLFMLADEHSKRGVSVPFFGQEAGTPTGPAVFARRLGCAVLPVSIVRRGKRHLLRIEPPLELVRTEDQEADIKNNTALFNRVIEGWVREDPEQWFGWFTRRFLPVKKK